MKWKGASETMRLLLLESNIRANLIVLAKAEFLETLKQNFLECPNIGIFVSPTTLKFSLNEDTTQCHTSKKSLKWLLENSYDFISLNIWPSNSQYHNS